MTWTPSLRTDVDLTALSLDPRQGFLLAQLDGKTELPALAQVTGLEPDQVTAMLEQLVTMGAVVAPEGFKPRQPAADRAPADPGTDPAAEVKSATHRQLFETRLRHLAPDLREAMASQAEEPDLSALCFDPVPKVIAALLENPRFGPAQARLVARHHPTGTGLEALAARAGITADPGVQRALLVNPVLPRELYRRLWFPKPLVVQFQVVADRDNPERTRANARDVLRAAFMQRPSEERVELILGSEGRCLAYLVGIALDSRTTALLCRRNITSTLLVQNIAAWGGAPPHLVQHLLHQEVVRRNPGLKRQLERSSTNAD